MYRFLIPSTNIKLNIVALNLKNGPSKIFLFGRFMFVLSSPRLYIAVACVSAEGLAYWLVTLVGM